MANFFNEVLYRPLFNALVFFYNNLSFGDLGVAIILFTIFVRVILLPPFYKSAKDQAIMQRLAPKIKNIQATHKNDREAHARALMELYREHKVNPISGFVMMIIQIAILIALYQVFLGGFTAENLDNLYSFIARPSDFDSRFLGLINLNEKNLFIVFAAALAQYFQGKLSLPRSSQTNGLPSAAEAIGRQMVYLGPVLTVAFLYFLPAAIGLYWLTTSLFSVIQQIVINQRITNLSE